MSKRKQSGSLKHVELKNGYRLPTRLCDTILWSLRLLADSDPIALVQLCHICKGADIFDQEVVDRLIGKHLLDESGRPHETIRNVVLYAVTSPFEGIIESPLKAE